MSELDSACRAINAAFADHPISVGGRIQLGIQTIREALRTLPAADRAAVGEHICLQILAAAIEAQNDANDLRPDALATVPLAEIPEHGLAAAAD